MHTVACLTHMQIRICPSLMVFVSISDIGFAASDIDFDRGFYLCLSSAS